MARVCPGVLAGQGIGRLRRQHAKVTSSSTVAVDHPYTCSSGP
ncbi:MAG: hypothetical protein RMJ98_20325 [Myxococcales bacterium]|nr:hypothetical protein [Polyangiaceae bacterium]MDW8251648.1 hypothetical protein [Myxococcales bacterium]